MMLSSRLALWTSLSLTLAITGCAKTPPTAVPGPDQMVAVGQVVQLDGSMSKDPASSPPPITGYAWTFTALPAGSEAKLNRNDIVNPSFTADVVGAYVLSLTVTDANGTSAPATVTITAVACAPKIAPIVAMPGSPNVGDSVQLSTMVTETCNDREPFVYAWSIASLPAGSKTTLSPAANPAGDRSAAQAPSFVPDTPGSYSFALRVTDQIGRFSDSTVTVLVATCGSAIPSVDQISATPATPNAFDVVQLSAKISDADTMSPCSKTETYTYAWTLLSAPTGSKAQLSATDSSVPWFQPDMQGTYTVRLVVSDALGRMSPAKTLDVTVAACGANPPVIAAITPSTTAPFLGEQVSIAATVTDADAAAGCGKMETFAYAWSLITQPAGSTATLQGANTATPTLTPDVAGVYQVQLTVTDSNGVASKPVQSAQIVASTCGLSAPVGQIGALAPFGVTAPIPQPPTIGMQVPIGSTVQLDASTSFDPDNATSCMLPTPQTLTYRWRFVSLPTGSNAGFNNSQITNPSFRVDQTGAYVVELTVTDSTGLVSAPVLIEINGYNPISLVLVNTGRYSSLVLDGGNPRIAFYDRFARAARIATCDGPTCQSTPAWTIHTIEGGGGGDDVGRQISLAVDPATHNLYAVYWDVTACSAHYAVSTDGGKTWSTSNLIGGVSNGCGTRNNNNGTYPSIALITGGTPAVAFISTSVTGGFIANNNLNYAVCNGGCTTTAPVWGLRTLATSNAGTNFGYTSIATDPTSGNPSIAFRTDTGNGGTSGIGYTACTGGCNQSSAAFTGILYIAADVGYTSPPGRGDDTTTSIAISSTGQPSIAYGDIGNGVLQYAHCAANCSQAAGWTLVTVDQNQVGQYASLALSPLAATLDLPRISYYDGNNQNLKFAQATGNQWLINTLDQSGNVGGYTSLALSPNDNPRISYYDQTTNAIRYFTSGN